MLVKFSQYFELMQSFIIGIKIKLKYDSTILMKIKH